MSIPVHGTIRKALSRDYLSGPGALLPITGVSIGAVCVVLANDYVVDYPFEDGDEEEDEDE